MGKSRIEWKDSALGIAENYVYKNLFKDRVVARTPAVSCISLSLDKVKFTDKEGTIRPNIWFWPVMKSGEGKTKLYFFVNDVLFKYNPKAGTELKLPSGSPAVVTEWICGTQVEREDAKKKYSPHLKSMNLVDEASTKIATVKMNCNTAVLEFYSELWDCKFSEPHLTRSSGFEGNAEPFVTAYMLSSERIYRLLDEYAYVQGLPYRPNWVTCERTLVTKADRNTYFFPETQGIDKERNFVVNKITESMKVIDNYKNVLPDEDATDYLIDYKYDLETRAEVAEDHNDPKLGALLKKDVMNSFKLSVIYAANCFSVVPRTSGDLFEPDDFIIINGEDVKRAREDTEDYIKCFQMCMKRAEVLANEKSYSTHTEDQRKVLDIIDSKPEGIPKSALFVLGFSAEDLNKILQTLAQADIIETFEVKGKTKSFHMIRRIEKDGNEE